MPQQRQRIVFCDCLDCLQQPATTDIASSTSAANEAAAKQEPPPKSLMFVLSGVLLPHPQQDPSGTNTVLDTVNLPHLNRATAQGNLCLLTVRDSSSADCCAELAQLLNIYEEWEQEKEPGTLADKFKGMQASFASNSGRACALAAACGLSSSTVLDPDPSTTAAGADGDGAEGMAAMFGSAARQRHGNTGGTEAAATVQQQLPDPAEAARRILLELGLQQAEAGLDMLIMHLDALSSSSSSSAVQQHLDQQQGSSPASAAASVALLAWVDRTMRYLNNSAAVKDTVLLSVLATPGAAGQLREAVPMLQAAGGMLLRPLASSSAGTAAAASAAAAAGVKAMSVLQPAGRPVLRPLQSWQQLGGTEVAVDCKRPLLCMRRLPGVIRRDGCTRFSLQDCCSSSGTLAILADHLIPEIAYKLGRAPKYGA